MPYDKRRSNKAFLCKKHPARSSRYAARLYLQICLHAKWYDGLFMVVDLVRSAFWSASDVSMDHSRWKILRWWYRHLRIQLHHRWCDRRFRPGLAPVGGSMVCTSDRIPADRRIRRTQHESMEILPSINTR